MIIPSRLQQLGLQSISLFLLHGLLGLFNSSLQQLPPGFATTKRKPIGHRLHGKLRLKMLFIGVRQDGRARFAGCNPSVKRKEEGLNESVAERIAVEREE